MPTAIFTGTSVDGFIARPNGALDFLDAGGHEPHGFDEFFASVDAIVIGRHTYETVLSFGGWAYGGKRVVVLAHGGQTTDPGKLSRAYRARCPVWRWFREFYPSDRVHPAAMLDPAAEPCMAPADRSRFRRGNLPIHPSQVANLGSGRFSSQPHVPRLTPAAGQI